MNVAARVYEGGRDILLRLIEAYPALVRAARTNSPKKAVRLFCLECIGGSPREVKECQDFICPLWPYRHGHGFEDPGLPIPEKEELSDEALEFLQKRVAKARAARAARGS